MSIDKKYQSYFFSSNEEINETDLQTLVSLFENGPDENVGVLGGRGKISRTSLSNGCRFVVKYYKRGGFIRHFNEQLYLRTGITRSEQEFRMLELAHDAGVRVPNPVIRVSKGGLFYKCWLVIEEVDDCTSLAEFSNGNPDNFDKVLAETIKQVRLLIKNKILHVDLHPGNVLVSNEKVYIIDFDKSKPVKWSEQKLKGFYIERWGRAIRKHNLSEKMLSFFEKNL